MIRTIVYLTRPQRTAVRSLAAAAGKSQSGIIREAVEQFVRRARQRNAILDACAGLWRDRDDLPSLPALRRGWNREARP